MATSTLSINPREYLFVEKYRPKTIDDLIVTKVLKEQLRGWIKDGEIPNLLLSSRTPGTGKTSLAYTLINELGADSIFINASLESNIDVLRNKIQGFASTASFDGRPKVIVLDEADYLNDRSTQPALRGFIEQFSKNARFILTCNTPSKLIEPLRNRLINIDFDEMFRSNKKELQLATAKRTIKVLENENISYEMEDIKYLARHYYPSNRNILNKVQQFTKNGKIEIDREAINTDEQNNILIDSIIGNKFEDVRKQVAKMPDPGTMFLMLFENINKFKAQDRPQIIILIGKYQSYDPHVRDRMVNSTACAVKIMQSIKK